MTDQEHVAAMLARVGVTVANGPVAMKSAKYAKGLKRKPADAIEVKGFDSTFAIFELDANGALTEFYCYEQ